MHYSKISFYAIADGSQHVPLELAEFLLEMQNQESNARMMHDERVPRSVEDFKSDWFGNYAAICFQESGVSPNSLPSVQARIAWKDVLLGSFSIKPSYLQAGTLRPPDIHF